MRIHCLGIIIKVIIRYYRCIGTGLWTLEKMTHVSKILDINVTTLLTYSLEVQTIILIEDMENSIFWSFNSLFECGYKVYGVVIYYCETYLRVWVLLIYPIGNKTQWINPLPYVTRDNFPTLTLAYVSRRMPEFGDHNCKG